MRFFLLLALWSSLARTWLAAAFAPRSPPIVATHAEIGNPRLNRDGRTSLCVNCPNNDSERALNNLLLEISAQGVDGADGVRRPIADLSEREIGSIKDEADLAILGPTLAFAAGMSALLTAGAVAVIVSSGGLSTLAPAGLQ
uniref:Uncharacterized protein n=2 Tax=Trieres chinensis TaxID=1514140 RepID=A0A7S1ZMF0_TRICV|mmetsp:Transcript_29137/g.59595  ORF Transcript_29137/g.59595 Transcript_29137/m.59595 type:complete len:142 (+) Transcript_29137:135-560(+)|eukprot:CAMPEP_0183313758 /NCGR_PEP_ID=MMETSP0160_2-20130417/46408_1 /TAXON_ID=2839 ORGANISM="Odontella Sinensis, Strain Grunow 1884" /NCGR_SAMPLE_ID=MMETSP0160_2 /ASSEMBLY_ACC=CAM_ASM_000250 /LENGTH=141 /DNA_ID=CAMNT_0025478911 /DNA_START=108 /DNA_END=533 /DNA_ORIENTATION=-